MNEAVARAYGARAHEYARLFGSVDDLSPRERERILDWAKTTEGSLLDLGCGPGQWTDLLCREGFDAAGIDLAPEFIALARARFPGVSFQVGDGSALRVADGVYGGVLAWYSLIHVQPSEMPRRLAEIRRVLSPDGRLLIGFFDGAHRLEFPHAVTTGYFASPAGMTRLLQEAGFVVIDLERRRDAGARPHASVTARVAP